MWWTRIGPICKLISLGIYMYCSSWSLWEITNFSWEIHVCTLIDLVLVMYGFSLYKWKLKEPVSYFWITFRDCLCHLVFVSFISMHYLFIFHDKLKWLFNICGGTYTPEVFNSFWLDSRDLRHADHFDVFIGAPSVACHIRKRDTQLNVNHLYSQPNNLSVI